jgi:hypothetical protein
MWLFRQDLRPSTSAKTWMSLTQPRGTGLVHPLWHLRTDKGSQEGGYGARGKYNTDPAFLHHIFDRLNRRVLGIPRKVE